MKLIILVLLGLGIVSGCSVSPESAQRKYGKLDNKFDDLVDDEVKEKDRAKLEKKYKKLERRMNQSSDPAMKSHKEKVAEKIQYLEDLAD
ncbi:hypothetical protein [Fusobacterium sp. PH5-44]|uniref:hypothetical protein n=1 Tax=unclassified Fusobacterium TaxID=2648384 RepID=UPI003D1939C8